MKTSELTGLARALRAVPEKGLPMCCVKTKARCAEAVAKELSFHHAYFDKEAFVAAVMGQTKEDREKERERVSRLAEIRARRQSKNGGGESESKKPALAVVGDGQGDTRPAQRP